jgi:drug/metabolite transporter (DMT)-like permease
VLTPLALDDTPSLQVWAALAALGSGLTWALGSLLFGRLLRVGAASRPSPAAANLFKNLLAALVFCAAWPLLATHWPAAQAWPWLLVSGVFGFAIGDTLYFASLPKAGVQIAAMVALTNVPAAVLLSWMFAGEKLHVATLAFMLVVVAGVLLVIFDARADSALSARTRRAGVGLALAAALAQAIGIVIGHRGMDGTDLLAGTLVRMLGGIGGGIVGALLAGLARRESSVAGEVRELVSPLRTPALWGGLFIAALFGSVIGLPLFHIGLRELPSGVASVLFATTPLFTLPLGFFFGARHGWRALVGTAIGFLGVAGLIWSLAPGP